MSCLTLSKEEVERRASEESHFGLLAEGLIQSLYSLAGSDGGAVYSVHVLSTGEYHVNRKGEYHESLDEITALVNNVAKSKSDEVRKKLVDALNGDIEFSHMVDLGKLIGSEFYRFNLNRLNGSRVAVVGELNVMLERYGIPKEYRFG